MVDKRIPEKTNKPLQKHERVVVRVGDGEMPQSIVWIEKSKVKGVFPGAIMQREIVEANFRARVAIVPVEVVVVKTEQPQTGKVVYVGEFKDLDSTKHIIRVKRQRTYMSTFVVSEPV